jgi:hypothetical protein
VTQRKAPKDAVTPPFALGADLDGEEELVVGLPPATAAAALPPAATAPVVDLTGQAKAWFAIGPGRSGKTTLLRYLAEVILDGGREALFAALDPQNRSLKGFLGKVLEAPTNDAAAVAKWLERLLRHLMAHRQSALLDLGGGDTSLGRLLAEVPDLAAALQEAGVFPVAVYTLGPRVDDLAALAGFEARGFRPRAVALLLNQGLADPTLPREDAFARVLRHSAFRAAVARGAVPLWMPRLEPSVAAEIEAKRLHFTDARDGQAPEGRQVAPLGPFDRSRVRQWLEAMAAELAPIRSWLP